MAGPTKSGAPPLVGKAHTWTASTPVPLGAAGSIAQPTMLTPAVTGMFVKLGFAVAIHCEPDILLVDEVLAVGDAAFRNKCLAKIREVRENGAASLIVSHNLDTVRFMSQRVVALEEGRVVDEGDPEKVILGYEARMIARERDVADKYARAGRRISSGEVRIESARVFAEADGREKEVPCGQPFCFELIFTSSRRVEHPLLSLGVLNSEGVPCIWNVSAEDGFELPPVEGRQRLRVLVADNSLVPGAYQVQLSIRERSTMETLERIAGIAYFTIKGNRKSRGIVQSRCDWEIKGLDQL